MLAEEIVRSLAPELKSRDVNRTVSNHGDMTRKRTELATELGLVPIGEKSLYCNLMAFHPENPDVVLKYCNVENDGFPLYALYCLHTQDEDCLRVFSVQLVGTGVLVAMERCHERDECGNKAFRPAQDRLRSYELHTRVNSWFAERGILINTATDDHDGNTMWDSAGQPVWIDPFSSAWPEFKSRYGRQKVIMHDEEGLQLQRAGVIRTSMPVVIEGPRKATIAEIIERLGESHD